jgi:hypothetical protein
MCSTIGYALQRDFDNYVWKNAKAKVDSPAEALKQAFADGKITTTELEDITNKYLKDNPRTDVSTFVSTFKDMLDGKADGSIDLGIDNAIDELFNPAKSGVIAVSFEKTEGKGFIRPQIIKSNLAIEKEPISNPGLSKTALMEAIESGENNPEVIYKALIGILAGKGYLDSPPEIGTLLKSEGGLKFSKTLSDAIKEFQKDNHLEEDGLPGPAVLGTMLTGVRFTTEAEALNVIKNFQKFSDNQNLVLTKTNEGYKINYLGNFADIAGAKLTEMQNNGAVIISKHFEGGNFSAKMTESVTKAEAQVTSSQSAYQTAVETENKVDAAVADTGALSFKYYNDKEKEIYKHIDSLTFKDDKGNPLPGKEFIDLQLTKKFREFIAEKIKFPLNDKNVGEMYDKVPADKLQKYAELYKKHMTWSAMTPAQMEEQLKTLYNTLEHEQEELMVKQFKDMYADQWKDELLPSVRANVKDDYKVQDKMVDLAAKNYAEFAAFLKGMGAEVPNPDTLLHQTVLSERGIDKSHQRAITEMHENVVYSAQVTGGDWAAAKAAAKAVGNDILLGIGRGMINTYDGIKKIITDPVGFADDMYTLGKTIYNDPGKFYDQVKKQFDEANSSTTGTLMMGGEAIFMLMTIPVEEAAFAGVAKGLAYGARVTRIAEMGAATAEILGTAGLKAIRATGQIVLKGINKIPKLEEALEFAVQTSKALKTYGSEALSIAGKKLDIFVEGLSKTSGELRAAITEYMQAIKNGLADKIPGLAKRVEQLTEKATEVAQQLKKAASAAREMAGKAVETAKSGLKQIKEFDQSLRTASAKAQLKVADIMHLPDGVKKMIGRDALSVLRNDLLPDAGLVAKTAGMGGDMADNVSHMVRQAQRLYPDNILGQFKYLEEQMANLSGPVKEALGKYLGAASKNIPITGSLAKAEKVLADVQGVGTEDIKTVQKIVSDAKASSGNKMEQLKFLEKKLAELKAAGKAEDAGKIKGLEQYIGDIKDSWFPPVNSAVKISPESVKVKDPKLAKISGSVSDELLANIDALDVNTRNILLGSTKGNPNLLRKLEGLSSEQLTSLVKMLGKDNDLGTFLGALGKKGNISDTISHLLKIDEAAAGISAKLESLAGNELKMAKELLADIKDLRKEIIKGKVGIEVNPGLTTHTGDAAVGAYENGVISLSAEKDFGTLMHEFKHHQLSPKISRESGEKLVQSIVKEEAQSLKAEAIARKVNGQDLPADMSKALENYMMGDEKAFERLATDRGVFAHASKRYAAQIGSDTPVGKYLQQESQKFRNEIAKNHNGLVEHYPDLAKNLEDNLQQRGVAVIKNVSFEIGDDVKVMRSNKQIEAGWKIDSLTPEGKIKVTKDNMEKFLNPEDITALNPDYHKEGAIFIDPVSFGKAFPDIDSIKAMNFIPQKVDRVMVNALENHANQLLIDGIPLKKVKSDLNSIGLKEGRDFHIVDNQIAFDYDSAQKMLYKPQNIQESTFGRQFLDKYFSPGTTYSNKKGLTYFSQDTALPIGKQVSFDKKTDWKISSVSPDGKIVIERKKMFIGNEVKVVSPEELMSSNKEMFKGMEFIVKRSDKSLDGGWHLVDIEGNKATLSKVEGGVYITRPANLSDLITDNRRLFEVREAGNIPKVPVQSAPNRIILSSDMDIVHKDQKGWKVVQSQGGYVVIAKGDQKLVVDNAKFLENNPGLLKNKEIQIQVGDPPNGLIVDNGWKVDQITADGVRVSKNGQKELVSYDQIMSNNPGLIESAGKKVTSVEADIVKSSIKVSQDISAQESKIVIDKTSLLDDSARYSELDANHAKVAKDYVSDRFGGNTFNKDFLIKNDLGPAKKIEIDGKTFYVSKPFDHKGQRKSFIVYAQNMETGQFETRVFYQSNSQGLWRSASHWKGMSGWIGKGLSEDSTTLPISMQKQLDKLSSGPLVKLENEVADTAFYGGLKVTSENAPANFAAEFSGETALGEFTERVPGLEGRSFGKPESFKWSNPEFKPDFNKPPFDSYKFNHPMHGDMEAFVFGSKDGQYNYLIYRNKQGKAWVAAIEDIKSPVNDFGVRKRVVDAGDLTTPTLEYNSQIPEGYRGKFVKKDYYDASAYVDKIDIIQDFYKWQKSSVTAVGR